MTNSDRHQKLLNEIHGTYITKNAAYGDSFAKSIAKYGYIAALVRLNDKFERLENLILQDGQENDERLRDTCLDAANYFLMLAMELEKKSDNDNNSMQQFAKDYLDKKAAANKLRPDEVIYT
jgi:hypothetical protein